MRGLSKAPDAWQHPIVGQTAADAATGKPKVRTTGRRHNTIHGCRTTMTTLHGEAPSQTGTCAIATPDEAPRRESPTRKESCSLNSRVRETSRSHPSRLHLHGAAVDAKTGAINTSNGRSIDARASLGKPRLRNSISYDRINSRFCLTCRSTASTQAFGCSCNAALLGTSKVGKRTTGASITLQKQASRRDREGRRPF
jgi:hypothetical protein